MIFESYHIMMYCPPKKFAVLGFLICLMLTVMISCGHKSSERKIPLVVRGGIDLMGWDFEKDGSLNLDGEWEFHWNRLLEPSDFATTDNQQHREYLAVPGLWEGNTVKGIAIPGKGQGTYRLQILNRHDDQLKTLIVRRVYSAYRLWINKKLVDERGKVDGRNNIPENYIFIHNKRHVSFTLNEGVNEIVLQVFNHDYESGGIDSSIRLENNVTFNQNRKRGYTIDMVLFGLLIFASVNNILSYFFRRQDSASLYFGTY